MDKLPTWVSDRLALLGDAAHPFLPHQGQGAGCAMEDAASLAVVLPGDTPKSEAPERLRLYERFRYERAHKIQEYSRLSGRDIDENGLDSECWLTFCRRDPGLCSANKASDGIHHVQFWTR